MQNSSLLNYNQFTWHFWNRVIVALWQISYFKKRQALLFLRRLKPVQEKLIWTN